MFMIIKWISNIKSLKFSAFSKKFYKSRLFFSRNGRIWISLGQNEHVSDWHCTTFTLQSVYFKTKQQKCIYLFFEFFDFESKSAIEKLKYSNRNNEPNFRFGFISINQLWIGGRKEFCTIKKLFYLLPILYFLLTTNTSSSNLDAASSRFAKNRKSKNGSVSSLVRKFTTIWWFIQWPDKWKINE
jgi:hypothetical protein